MANSKICIGIILSLVVFIIFREATRPVLEHDSTTITDRVDSIVVVTKIDTVFIKPDTVVIKLVPELDSETDTPEGTLRSYNSPVRDRNLTGTIYTTVLGLMHSQNFEYVLKGPETIYIRDTETVYRTRTITYQYSIKQRLQLHAGVEGGHFKGEPSLSLMGQATFTNSYRVHYRYDALHKAHSIGLLVPIL